MVCAEPQRQTQKQEEISNGLISGPQRLKPQQQNVSESKWKGGMCLRGTKGEKRQKWHLMKQKSSFRDTAEPEGFTQFDLCAVFVSC